MLSGPNSLPICIAILAEGAAALDFSGKWVIFTVQQLTLGPLVGGLVGWAGGWAAGLAAGLARRAGHYERARWAYRYALDHYERMEKAQEAEIVRDLLSDLR